MATTLKISESTLGRLFGPFFGRSSTKKLPKGLGFDHLLIPIAKKKHLIDSLNRPSFQIHPVIYNHLD